MSKAISLHIGLNNVDPDAYEGWDGQLYGCVNDAMAMKNIAESLSYDVSTTLLNEEATADRVILEIGQAAWNLEDGGIFLLTYSGHGGQMTDVNGDESDGKDETWVCYDRHLIDDELSNLWNQFGSGTRIVIVSDSCHSGTVSRGPEYQKLARSDVYAPVYGTKRAGPPRFRAIPQNVADANYAANQARYKALQFAAGNRTRGVSDATVLLISGCQDNQLSSDGDGNGLFTANLLAVWSGGSFNGDYRAFHQAICDKMPATQSPNYYVVGASNPDFEAQQPFTVAPARTGIGMSPAPAPTRTGPIDGPRSVARKDLAPAFHVNAGPNRYYAVEIASEAELFDVDPTGRRSDNFYASWAETGLMRTAIYTLPEAVWGRLRGASQLFYRISSSSIPNGWADYQVSASLAGPGFPKMQITS